MADVVVWALCLPLVLLTFGSLWLRRASLTLVDVFLLSIALYFGAYTIVNASLAGTRGVDSVLLAVSLEGVCLAAFILWAFARFGPKVSGISLREFYADLGATPAIQIWAIIGIGVAYRVYSAVMLTDYDVDNSVLYQAQEDRGLPYWYTSAGMVLPYIMFAAGLASWVKAMAVRGVHRAMWLTLTMASALFFYGMGRRAFLAFLVVAFLMLVSRARARKALIFMILAAAPVMLAASNVYQAYRLFSYSGMPITAMSADIVIATLQQATDSERTASNIAERPALWRYTYEVMEAREKGRPYQYGWLFFGALPNYVPYALKSDKTYFSSEREMQQAFRLDVRDNSENVFVYTYADFGYLGFIVAPAMLLFFVWACSLILQWLTDPFLRIALLGGALFYALNLEADYTTPIKLARDFALMSMVYLGARTAWRYLAYLFDGQFRESL